MEKVLELLKKLNAKKSELVKNAKNPDKYLAKEMFTKKQFEEWQYLCGQEKGITDTLIALGHSIEEIIKLSENIKG